MKRKDNLFLSENKTFENFFSIQYSVGDEIQNKNSLEYWLTERYRLFYNYKKQISDFEIYHKIWELSKLKIQRLIVDYPKYYSFFLSPPSAMHFAKDVDVFSWKKTK